MAVWTLRGKVACPQQLSLRNSTIQRRIISIQQIPCAAIPSGFLLQIMNTRLLGSFILLNLGVLQIAHPQEPPSATIRAGMIGLDTSHVPAFAKIFNHAGATSELAGIRIVAGYPGGTDLPASHDRVGKFTEELRGMGIEIVDSIPKLLSESGCSPAGERRWPNSSEGGRSGDRSRKAIIHRQTGRRFLGRRYRDLHAGRTTARSLFFEFFAPF